MVAEVEVKKSFSTRAGQYTLMLLYHMGRGVHLLVAEERRGRLRSAAQQQDMFVGFGGILRGGLPGKRFGEGTRSYWVDVVV